MSDWLYVNILKNKWYYVDLLPGILYKYIVTKSNTIRTDFKTVTFLAPSHWFCIIVLTFFQIGVETLHDYQEIESSDWKYTMYLTISQNGIKIQVAEFYIIYYKFLLQLSDVLSPF